MLQTDLSEIFKNQETTCSCIGSILEAKKYPKIKNPSNFSYKLSIIDQSFSEKLQKLTIYLYFDVNASIPYIFKIGDIVYLLSYKVKKNKKLERKKKNCIFKFKRNLLDSKKVKGFSTLESNFFIFDDCPSNNNQSSLTVSITDIDNGYYEFDSGLQKKVLDLQKWKNKYFAENSCNLN